MYKCLDCGEVFEEPAPVRETHGFTDGFAETFYMCPHCNGDYEETKRCQECEEWHTEDELYASWCEKCLRETINYDSFFEYCEANKDEQYLDIFVMSELLGGMDCPKHSTVEFHSLMVDYYKRMIALDKDVESICGGKSSLNFLDACTRFIMDDDGEIGRENYADWLNSKKEVK
jgi:hypothetical protein